jgi:hypothetical protein
MTSPSRPFTGIRLVGVLLLAGGLAACGLVYFLFVERQQQYLVERNFRVLTSIGSQIESAARAEARVFENIARDKDGQNALRELWKARYQGARPDIPHMERARARMTVVRQDASYQLSIMLSNPSPPQPSPAPEKPPASPAAAPQPVNIQLPISRVTGPTLVGKIGPGSFETLLLVDADGKLLSGEGRWIDALGSAGLSELLAPTKDGHARPFNTISAMTTVEDVLVAGSLHKLFVTPCCTTMTGDGKRLVVAGLVSAAAFNEDSRAISTTIVKLGAMMLLLAAVGWPYLRLSLVGERQRLRRSDFFLLGLSGVASLAVVTVLVLDATAYWRLDHDHDAQLRLLADQVEAHAAAEMHAAYEQLNCLESQVVTSVAVRLTPDSGAREANAASRSEPAGAVSPCGSPTAAWSYPFFESVSLIDAAGLQQQKLSTLSWVPSKIPVADREYFKASRSGNLWRNPEMCPDGCILESLWSWTTGEPQAVLAKPFAKGNIAVASIAIPMLSLIRPVMPAGFQFAVIADDGKVLFHSDYQRNLNENLFQETDDSRRLRAQMHAHSSETLNLRYWGAAYRAFVKPMHGTPWSIVTMYRKDEAWALNREWLIVSFIFLGFYLFLWGILAAATLISDSSWVWPDAARKRQYHAVAWLHGCLLLIAAGSLYFSERGGLLRLAYLLPLIGWLGTAVILKQRRENSAQPGDEPVFQFSVAAGLTFAVCGIVPGALLFIASFQIHTQSYVKNNELDIARRIRGREAELARKYPVVPRGDVNIALDSKSAGQLHRDRYYDFLYGMNVADADKVDEPIESRQDFVLATIEEYLPYYSEASVRWRELIHDQAGDSSWRSYFDGSGRMVLVTADPSQSTRVESRVPSLLTSEVYEREPGTRIADLQAVGSSGPPMIMGTFVAGLGLLTFGIVWMLRRYIYLSGVVQPRWARVRLALDAGDNVFVRCNDQTTRQQIEGALPLKLGAIAQADDPARAWRRLLIDMDRSDEAVTAVLVDDFDDELDNVTLMDLKLGFMEDLVADSTRAVVVLARHSPSAMADSLRRSAVAAGGSASDRWTAVMRSFVVMDWRGTSDGPAGALAEIAVGSTEPGEAPRAESADVPRSTPAIGRKPTAAELFLDQESLSGDIYVRKLCDALRRLAAADQPLSREQIVDELVDRTTRHYQRIWNGCSDEDRVVLTHVAQDGLANWALRRGVRRLLAKRLLLKNPELRVMNDTFRQFLLSPACRKETRALESSNEPSAWDRLRLPFGMAMVGVGVFLFVTQKELYNAILGTTTAIAVSVPTLIRALGTLAGGQGPDSTKAA